MTAKFGKVEIYSKGSPSIKSTWSSDHVTDRKRYISTSARSMATKLDRVVGSNADLLSTKSYNLLITWSHKVTKNVINSFSRYLWLSNLTEGWLMIRSHMSNSNITYPSDHTVTWGHVTNELHYMFIFTKPIATKFDRMMACEIKISTTV